MTSQISVTARLLRYSCQLPGWLNTLVIRKELAPWDRGFLLELSQTCRLGALHLGEQDAASPGTGQAGREELS